MVSMEVRLVTIITLLSYVSRGQDLGSRDRTGLTGTRLRPVTRERAGPELLIPEVIDQDYNQTFPGCWLGETFYMVGDRWSPSIDPLGIMYCVKCQCAQVVKNNKIQLKGKVICRNIKAECPRVTCSRPKLRPQTCCRVCPGQGRCHIEGLVQNYYAYFEDQFGKGYTDFSETTPTEPDKPVNTQNQNQDMTALLVGSTRGRRKPLRTRAVAVIHVTNILEDSFNYVIRFSRLKSPIYLRFTDEYGKVLLEKPFSKQSTRSGRVSGSWSDIPLHHMQYVIQERAYVTISTSRHWAGEISGRLVVNAVATKATFEALLSPPEPRGQGAFAQVFFDTDARIGSYFIRLDGFKYLQQEEFFVTFEKNTEIIHQHLLRLSMTKAQVVGKITLDKHTSKKLARGRLQVRVTSRSGDTVIGLLKPRMHRTELVAVFQGDHVTTNVTGFAALTLEENGALRYKVVVNGLSGKSVAVSLQRAQTHRERWKNFAVLPKTPMLHTPEQTNLAGFYKKLRTGDTIALLDNELRLQIMVDNDIIDSYFEASKSKSIDIFTASHAVLRATTCHQSVIVLFNITPYCTFVYHVVSHNMTSASTSFPADASSLMLSDSFGFRDEHHYLGMPEGSINNVPNTMFKSLRNGEAMLSWHLLRGRCDEVDRQRIVAPNNCVLSSKDGEDNEAEKSTNHVHRCYHEGRFHIHGETWPPLDHNNCVTCRCDKGNVFCDEMPCPSTDCQYPRKRENECCPVCEEDNDTEPKILGSCYYHGDKRWHPVGTKWHPYVPPFGYSKCALCKCIEGTLEVNCTRTPCPQLDCPQYQRVRLDKDDCCQVCREPRRVIDKAVSNRNDCKFGSNVYKHGQKWHPWLTPFGEMKCYICSCKNGKSRCKKLRCEPLSCEVQHHPPGHCCPLCKASPKGKSSRDIDDRKSWSSILT